MAADDDCPLSAIVAREDEDVRGIHRDDKLIVIFPTEPATLGHTMVIPRSHVRDIWAIDSETASQLALATVRAAHAVRSAMQLDGLKVIQSNGEAAGQTVMHLHIRVVPRHHDDQIGRIWPPETNPEQAKDDA